MPATMPQSLPQPYSQFLLPSNQKGDINVAEQMQEQIVKLQQALELESTLRRISETIQTSLDEADILKTTVQELALKLKADCYISLDPNAEIDQLLRAEKDLRFCFNASSSPEKNIWLTCPIVNENEQLGTLWVIRGLSDTLIDSEVYLIQQVVKQCAIALHQSRLYQATQQQVEELKRLNEVKNDFLNRVTHDLRSPLANMRLAIHRLEHQLTIGRTQCGHISQQNAACTKTLTHVKILQSECEREIALVNDLLDLQHLESNQQILNAVDVIDLGD
jgi:signal transduction histidine kinase